jgi:hypothetical protein
MNQILSVVRYWFPACFENDGESSIHYKYRGGAYSCVCPRLNLLYGHFQLGVDEHTIRQEREGDTIASVQKGEKEKEYQRGEEMPVDFPQ